jgi:hypothetical protein
MKIRDIRHHAEDRDTAMAEILLDKLADTAYLSSAYTPSCRFDCRDTTHFHAKPGAFVERLSQAQRDLLKKLKLCGD